MTVPIPLPRKVRALTVVSLRSNGSVMRNMSLTAVMWVAGLLLVLQVVSGQIPVSFDHGKPS